MQQSEFSVEASVVVRTADAVVRSMGKQAGHSYSALPGSRSSRYAG